MILPIRGVILPIIGFILTIIGFILPKRLFFLPLLAGRQRQQILEVFFKGRGFV
ncbi:hypothetical protein [Alteribacter keqinensis]|uniref:hypothetical protein n=1 Tax=Alteribacter keqinensis TaxID=2483800 RepID=UPI00160568FB|nr:hypothetical protein [Alteribacter keqinensis]